MCVLRHLTHYIITHPCYHYIAYKKDGCADDPGWCFRDAVNNSLPASFHSYGQPSATDSAQPESAAPYSDMQVPSVAEILATAQKYPSAPNSAWDAFAPVSKTHGPADQWASPETIAPDGFKRSISASQKHEAASPVNPVSYEGMDMTPAQRSVAKGYSDGFLTSKIFASQNTSKLGFIGQYIEDSIRTLGGVVAPGTEGSYRQGFMTGLQDGEAKIMSTLKR